LQGGLALAPIRDRFPRFTDLLASAPEQRDGLSPCETHRLAARQMPLRQINYGDTAPRNNAHHGNELSACTVTVIRHRNSPTMQVVQATKRRA
jgi:hypothetical protein